MTENNRIRGEMTINVNRIHIISSQSKDDFQTARRLYEDLVTLHVAEKSPAIYFNQVANKNELNAVLDSIRRDCILGAIPIIHIECHGGIDNGLELSSGEFASWQWLVNRCREINIACGKNLGVVLAACFGLYAINPIKLDLLAPFAYLIASDSKVSAGSIDEKMRPFYQKLFENESMESALAVLGDEFKPFYAEKFLVATLATYIKSECMGKSKSQRRENLISEAISQGTPNTKVNRRAIRKMFKEQVTPRPALLNKYAKNFLGRPCSVTFQELMAFVSQL